MSLRISPSTKETAGQTVLLSGKDDAPESTRMGGP